MKKVLIVVLLTMMSVYLVAQESHPGLFKLMKNVVIKLGTDPMIVAAVKAKNTQNESMDTIKMHDQEWIAATTPTPFMKEIFDNETSKHLRQLSNTKAYYAEIFAMDKNGAIVALTNLTSDYWQGDEDKFTKSYADGKGATHIGEAKFDESTQKELVQVSVPVKDGDMTIGAVTVGIVVDEIE